MVNQPAAANHAPTAIGDAFTGTVGTPLVISDPATGVLGNDTDPEGDSKLVESHTDTTNGSLTLNDDGTFTYGPNDAAVTSDAFTYTIKDNKDAVGNSANVTITLNPAAGIAVR
jgi:VCBS repeat-containing protein